MKTNPDFDIFFQAYLTAALWSSTISEGDEDNPDEREGDPFDRHFSTDDFTPEALEILRAHALSFWSRIACYVPHETGKPGLGKVTCDVENAGHDFWLTQNGHGAGFWDGDWPTYGEMFTKLSKCYPEIDLGISENDKVTI